MFLSLKNSHPHKIYVQYTPVGKKTNNIALHLIIKTITELLQLLYTHPYTISTLHFGFNQEKLQVGIEN